MVSESKGGANVNLEQVFKRVVNDWQQFGMIGLGAFVVNMVAGLIGSLAALVLVGPGFMAMAMGRMEGGMIAFFGAFLGFMVVAMVVGVLAGGLSSAGVVGSVLGYRRGEQPSLHSFWAYATRYYGKLILLGFIFALIVMVSALVNIIPVLGQLAFFLWLPVASVALGIYPAHLIISRGLGVVEALSIGWNLLTGQFKETFISGMILLVIGVVMGTIGLIPLIGWLAVSFLAQPLIMYLFVERFEAEVAPRLNLPPV